MRQETDRYRAMKVVEKMCKDRYDLFLECTKDYVESVKKALPKEYVEKWWSGDCPNVQQRVKEYLIEDILCDKFSYSFYLQPHPKAYKYDDDDEIEEERQRRYPFQDTHLPSLPGAEEESRKNYETIIAFRALKVTNPAYGIDQFDSSGDEENWKYFYSEWLNTYILEMFNVGNEQNGSRLLYDYLRRTTDEKDKCFKILNEKIDKLKKQEMVNEMKTSTLLVAAMLSEMWFF